MLPIGSDSHHPLPVQISFDSLESASFVTSFTEPCVSASLL